MIEFIKTKDFKITEPTVVTIGKFDGEHRGHKKIFDKMSFIAKEKKLKKAIFSFDISPSKIIDGLKQSRLTTNQERLSRIRQESIDYFIEYPFTEELAHMQAESFVREILIKKMNMKAIVAGTDVAFGYKKSGNKALLDKLSKELSFDVYIIEKEKTDDKEVISSTLIRKLLMEGNIKKANELLAAYYSISGIVSVGNKIGKKLLGFPTLNIFPPDCKILPKLGVYATKVKLLKTNEIFDSITNVGKNPTIRLDTKKHIIRVETHIFNFDRDIYGEAVEVFFVDFIRAEKAFEGIEALKIQIEKDKKKAVNILKKAKNNLI